MTDPTIVTLERDYPHVEIDGSWREHFQERALRRLEDIPARYVDAAVTEQSVADWVRSLVASAVADQRSPGAPVGVSTGGVLLLFGPTSTGKTHQCYGVVRALAYSGVICNWCYTTVPDLNAALRPRPGVDSEEVFERYATAKLLILDDLGANKDTEWSEETMFRLINYRYNHILPTIVTSNDPPKELSSRIGRRITDRLADVDTTTRVSMTGPNRRRGGAQ